LAKGGIAWNWKGEVIEVSNGKIQKSDSFLADRTNGRTIGTVLRLSVACHL